MHLNAPPIIVMVRMCVAAGPAAAVFFFFKGRHGDGSHVWSVFHGEKNFGYIRGNVCVVLSRIYNT